MRANIFPNYSKSDITFKSDKSKYKEDNLRKNSNDLKYDPLSNSDVKLPEIVIMTSYPPRECGIATYSQDLKNAIQQKFGSSFTIKICALEAGEVNHQYPKEVKYRINTQEVQNFTTLAKNLNANKNISMLFLQHEFGLFGGNYGEYLLPFLKKITTPVSTTFHTVLPNPNDKLKSIVQEIAYYSESIVVMTIFSKQILIKDYGISIDKITVIAHGTHLVAPVDNTKLKLEHQFNDKIVLSTFGLLSEGKSIETALMALPKIIKKFPNVLYLIIGKTHPEVFKNEGEKYRESLQDKVKELKLEDNVKFINHYLSLDDLMHYLQRTQLYFFTSKDPNQAVSGTLAYAMACGCPVIATPIPHAKEFLIGAGLNYDFQDFDQLANKTIRVLNSPKLLEKMRLSALQKISSTSWENAAIAHIQLVKNSNKKIELVYDMPKISLDHIKRMTTKDGYIQFSKIAVPDISSGYTIDDNARALIAVTKHYQLNKDPDDLKLIQIYLDFILFCQQKDGSFLNYVDVNGKFTANNHNENLEDANGRGIWALGEFSSFHNCIPAELIEKARTGLKKSLNTITTFKSPRAISFSIKGLYYYNLEIQNNEITQLITTLADNLVSKYRGVSDEEWKWYEEYLTYANSIIPEAMLFASLATGSKLFKNIAKDSFDFLLSVIFTDTQIKVISNQGWYQKGQSVHQYGEQPIDVAYTILALRTFLDEFKENSYRVKMKIAFDWFLGNNHLKMIIYNPKTGGCYDGLEEKKVNLNQGAESTISYLLSRLTMDEIMSSAIEIANKSEKNKVNEYSSNHN
ncbi:glycosyltransferase involved in cell wall biosynthesis [Flavobacterium sp. PL11]|uniref:glycosyltransferase n=1 Tax=Flavobacterium sp. PL11 TaxID=3071717 RepID=UPI002E00C72E|nr:glycosyltransferase involved in cell wall biosynthesis [Flavobacterium sp. PL11]